MKSDDLKILQAATAAATWVAANIEDAERLLRMISKGATVQQIALHGSVDLEKPEVGKTCWSLSLLSQLSYPPYGQQMPPVCALDGAELLALKQFLELRIERLKSHLAQQKVRVG